MGSPDNALAPAKQGFPGKQIGVGSPLNPFAAPSAVPNTTNKNPSMLFAFTRLSSAAVAALARILSEDQPRIALKNAHPVCHNLKPIRETP
jgi:hypothetical protein